MDVHFDMVSFEFCKNKRPILKLNALKLLGKRIKEEKSTYEKCVFNDWIAENFKGFNIH